MFARFLTGQEIELAMHDGTVRDVCFLEDTSNKSSLLISGGAGDCKIYVTDCATGQPYQALSGHCGKLSDLLGPDTCRSWMRPLSLCQENENRLSRMLGCVDRVSRVEPKCM